MNVPHAAGGPAVMEEAKRYASDRSSRRRTRSAFEALRHADDEVLEPLIRRLASSTEVADRALSALLATSLPPRLAAGALLGIIETEQDSVVLAAVAEALRDANPAFSAQELRGLARHSSVDVRRAVAANLYGSKDSTVFAALLDLADDFDSEVRDWAAWALADGFPASAERDRALRNWLHDARPDTQLTARIAEALDGRDRQEVGLRIDPGPKPGRREYAGVGKVTVLMTSANPIDTDELALDEEAREITGALRQTPARDVVDLRVALAARPLDLLVELNERQPQILHFSGHGTPDGRLVFLDAEGYGKPVEGTAVAAALSSAGETVRVVVLNACFSADLADALTAHIDVAVGMNRPVGDHAARVFAQAFYGALGYGSSVARAFEQAKAALMLEGIPEHTTPQLSSKQGIDPHELVLVDRSLVSKPDPRADQARLLEVTAQHLRHLSRHAELPIADGVVIQREAHQLLRDRVEVGSLYLVGPPGSGKSGAFFALASELMARGRDVVVLSADLLSAGGRRGLQDELGLGLEIVDALAAWHGQDPAYLLIDGLDAARGREASGALLDVVRRVAARGKRWRVVASIRSFDLRHSPELQAAIPSRPSDAFDLAVDPEFESVRHFALDALTDAEMVQVSGAAPALQQFLSSAAVELVDLLRTPFNLRLLVVLLARNPGDSARLHGVRTQLQLLDLYWEHRVLAPPEGRDAREATAAIFCDVAVAQLRLSLPRSSLRSASAAGRGLEDLLIEGVLVEQKLPGAGGDVVSFAHHILFDYAVHRLVLSGTPDEIASRLSSLDVVLLARPSLVLSLLSEWHTDAGRERFWRLALRLAGTDVVAPARLVAPAVFVANADNAHDAGMLFAALDNGDPAAVFLLRHLVGAVAAEGTPSRPLANANLQLWSEVAALLRERLGPATSYALRILVWGLTAEIDRHSGDLAALGVTARALLLWAWDYEPGQSPTVAVGVEAVARTCRTDPEATRQALTPALEPERWSQYGSFEIRQVADELDSLAACIPDLAADVFTLAFEHEEDSDEKTSFGSGQILRLTSTRRQDWGMVLYGLVRQFPALLKSDKIAALRAIAAASSREAQRCWKSAGAGEYEIQLGGTTYRLLSDHSAYWDGTGRHDEGVEMLDAFEEELLASVGADDASGEWLAALASRTMPEAVWRRVLRVAAKAPDSFGRVIAPVASALPVIVSRNLREPLGELLQAAAGHWNDDQRMSIERSLLQVPAALPPDRQDIAEHIQAELFACLPADLLQTDEGKAIRAKAEAEGVLPPDAPIRFTTGWVAADPDQELRDRGIEPKSPENEELLGAIAGVSEFVRAHVNTAPSLEQAHAALPAVKHLHQVTEEKAGLGDPSLINEAEAWLSEAAAALAAQTPLPVGDESIAVARTLAINGVSGALPAGRREDVAEFDRGGPSWGVPSGRIDAARALLLLCREAETADQDLLAATEQLANDPDPAVRWMVARSLSNAVATHPEWTWATAKRIATTEPSAQVREAVLHCLGRFSSDRADEVVRLLHEMFASETARDGHESLLSAITDFLVDLWVWKGHRGGRQLIDNWISDIRSAPAKPRQIFFRLRGTVTHGGPSVDDFAVRERAIGIWADLTRAALDAFREALPLVRAGDVDPAASERVAALASLLDGSATEVYFASGAYSGSKRELKTHVRQRFYREAAQLIDVLVDVGIPSAAHHVLQTLASFVDFDPRGVLLRLGRLLEAGHAWGYQLEGLAESEFVRLVERYLSSHRDLFMRDEESRAVLVDATEGFVEAGWPSARRLLYGFDDMFR